MVISNINTGVLKLWNSLPADLQQADINGDINES